MKAFTAISCGALLLTCLSWADDTAIEVQKQFASIRPGQQIEVVLKDGTKLKGALFSVHPDCVQVSLGLLGSRGRKLSFTEIQSVKRVRRPIAGLGRALAQAPIFIFCGVTFGKGCGEL